MAGFMYSDDTPRSTWGEGLGEELSKLGWSVGVSVGIALIGLTDMGRPSPLWVAPFPRQGSRTV